MKRPEWTVSRVYSVAYIVGYCAKVLGTNTNLILEVKQNKIGK